MCSRQLQPHPSTKEGNLHFASCCLLCQDHCTHFITATWVSEINTCLPSTDYTEQGETRKTTQINESWKQGAHISANITCLARELISLQQLVLIQLHNIYLPASMSRAFTYIQAFDILNLLSHQISHSEDKFSKAQNTDMVVPCSENAGFITMVFKYLSSWCWKILLLLVLQNYCAILVLHVVWEIKFCPIHSYWHLLFIVVSSLHSGFRKVGGANGC